MSLLHPPREKGSDVLHQIRLKASDHRLLRNWRRVGTTKKVRIQVKHFHLEDDSVPVNNIHAIHWILEKIPPPAFLSEFGDYLKVSCLFFSCNSATHARRDQFLLHEADSPLWGGLRGSELWSDATSSTIKISDKHTCLTLFHFVRQITFWTSNWPQGENKYKKLHTTDQAESSTITFICYCHVAVVWVDPRNDFCLLPVVTSPPHEEIQTKCCLTSNSWRYLHFTEARSQKMSLQSHRDASDVSPNAHVEIIEASGSTL